MDRRRRSARQGGGGLEQSACCRVKSAALILVVDDNEAGMFLACSVLQREGFQVESAGRSDEVLECLSAPTPDLILMDVQLPGHDGLALTRQLKPNPSTAQIPILP